MKKLHEVPKAFAQSFFNQINVLNNDEVSAIINDCDFKIRMPDAESPKVEFYIITQKALPTKIYNKLVNFPKERLEIIISTNGNDSDYSKMGEYIQDWLKKNYPSSYTLHDLLQPNNYSVQDGVITVLYVSDSQLNKLKEI